MPSRRQPKKPSSNPVKPVASPAASGTTRDPAEMFAAALKESEAQDKVQREKERQRQQEAADRKAAERAQADALASARRDLDRAIQAVRAAKANGRSTVEADAAWKVAKARVIELETGAAPTWAPPPPAPEVADAVEGAIASPVDGDAVPEESA